MLSLSARLGLEEPLWDQPFLTADSLGSLLGEEPLEGAASTPSDASLSPSSSPSSPSLFGCPSLGKADDDLGLHWLSAGTLLDTTAVSSGKESEDAFSGMDWMAEKIDLSEFDLDSLMGSCASDDPPSSPEELIASLENDLDLDLDPLPLPDPLPTVSADDALVLSDTQQDVAVPLPELLLPLPIPLPLPLGGSVSEPLAQAEPEIKNEPASPVSSPPPPEPTFTLELGSEVDVSECERLGAGTPKVAVLTLSANQLLLVLSTKEEAAPLDDGCPSDSDSGIGSGWGSPQRSPVSEGPSGGPSPPAGSARAKPYPCPSPAPQDEPALTGKVKSAGAAGAPKVVEKKLKKMEQNKTAATRYRQKKRAEQEALGVECTELEKRNKELTEKADSISKEIQYLKDLIEEVRSAKSRKGRSAASP
ncbi:ATF4 factor, partial [Atractosteus spatula]|nr:ATF4 factor [Atractosteus spatula]